MKQPLRCDEKAYAHTDRQTWREIIYEVRSSDGHGTHDIQSFAKFGSDIKKYWVGYTDAEEGRKIGRKEGRKEDGMNLHQVGSLKMEEYTINVSGLNKR
jgi:hypothetical protein